MWRSLGNEAAALAAESESPWKAHHWAAVERDPAALQDFGEEGVSDLSDRQRFDAMIRIFADGPRGVVEYWERNSPTVRGAPHFESELLRALDGRSMMRTLDAWAFLWLEKPEQFGELLRKFLEPALGATIDKPYRLFVETTLLGALPWEIAANIPAGQPCRVMGIEYTPKPPDRTKKAQFEEIGVVDSGNADYPSLRNFDVSMQRLAEATGRSVRPLTIGEVYGRESVTQSPTQNAPESDFLGSITRVQLLYLACPIIMESEVSETYLSGPGGSRFSARALGRSLNVAQRARGGLRTVVLLDTPLPRGGPHEARRAIMWRNLFAAELFQAGEPLAVIAAAIPQEPSVSPQAYAQGLLSRLTQGATLLEIMLFLRRPEHGWAASATAIFTEEPFGPALLPTARPA